MSYIESLRVFVRVMELGSITSGGRDLRLTPAVASKRLKELENHLGVRLFNRTTRSMTPTEVGTVFYDEAKAVLLALDHAEARVASFSDAPRGRSASPRLWVSGAESLRLWCRNFLTATRKQRFACVCLIARWTFWPTVWISPFSLVNPAIQP